MAGDIKIPSAHKQAKGSIQCLEWQATLKEQVELLREHGESTSDKVCDSSRTVFASGDVVQ
ncbi:hypothetical protein GN244_ATG12697 [Phytophthora infestans]|uniref:Uncharacterized protein n=1 Tax=Phytophthora infestans TaxID=4787 RepID=A0A833T7Z4_PHYIN|nr:hypothetical protein GN244_ATG12697 [Phytophthora infestans]